MCFGGQPELVGNGVERSAARVGEAQLGLVGPEEHLLAQPSVEGLIGQFHSIAAVPLCREY